MKAASECLQDCCRDCVKLQRDIERLGGYAIRAIETHRTYDAQTLIDAMVERAGLTKRHLKGLSAGMYEPELVGLDDRDPDALGGDDDEADL